MVLTPYNTPNNYNSSIEDVEAASSQHTGTSGTSLFHYHAHIAKGKINSSSMAHTNNTTAAAHSAGNNNTVAAIHVGTPSPDFQEWTSTKVYFHGFADLRKGGGYVDSPTFSCLGHEWRIQIHPFSKHHRRCSSIHLMCLGALNTAIDYSIIIKDWNDNQYLDASPGNILTIGNRFKPKVVDVPRHYTLSMLVNGALLVEVRMKFARRFNLPIIPKTNPDTPLKLMTDIFNDKESADVVFEVGGKQIQGEGLRENIRRMETDRFYAHTIILKKAAPLLAELIRGSDPITTVEIPNMKPIVFHILLLYIYYGNFNAMAVHKKVQVELDNIMKAADRFGIICLKLEAEAGYVTSTTLTLDNVMENLHFADSLNLALLKEAAMDFIVKNKVEMLEKKILTHATIEGLGSDILAAVLRGEKYGGAVVDYEENFNAISVSELRLRAHEEGLDIDGSREMLISALEKKKSEDAPVPPVSNE
jgi:hypothetical protein